MNITRENIDALNATVRIDIVKEDYEEKVEKKLREHRRTAVIKGFRPGHVPIGLIRKMYGTGVLVDEINNIVAKSLSDYIRDENLNILGDPIPAAEGNLFEPDKSDNFTLNFELGIAPEFEIAFTKDQQLTRYIIMPDAAMVADSIDNYARRHGEYVTAGLSEEKDMLKGSLAAADGTIINEDASLSVEVIKDEEIRKEFTGRGEGDTVSFDIRRAFPNDYEIAGLLKMQKDEVKDVNGTFTLTIREVSRFTPAENDQLLWDKIYGEGKVHSVAEFEARVTEEIEAYFEQEALLKLRTDARSLALEKIPFELPDEFLRKWLLRTNEQSAAEEIEKEYDHFREDLRWQLIKNDIAKENDLKISDEDMLEEAKAITRAQFAQYGLYQVTDEQLASFAAETLRREDDANRIAARILDTQVLDSIINSVKVDERSVTPEEFNQLSSAK